MKRSSLWLALAAAWLTLPAAAAPAPTPGSQGPITDALRMRDKLPKTAPPTAAPAVIKEEGFLEMERRSMVYVAKQVTETVERDGKPVTVQRIVTEAVPQVFRTRYALKECKFFLVTNEGKLEALDAKKAAGMLKKETPVLTGLSADVDPKSLEMVKPGTIYVVTPVNQAPGYDLTPPPEIRGKVKD